MFLLLFYFGLSISLFSVVQATWSSLKPKSSCNGCVHFVLYFLFHSELSVSSWLFYDTRPLLKMVFYKGFSPRS